MNHGHHLVGWYGTAGMGGVLHTVNPRLFDEQLVYIINHAADRMLFFDAAFLPLIERLRDQLSSVEHFVLFDAPAQEGRSEEHTSELQCLMRTSYAVICLNKKNQRDHN